MGPGGFRFWILTSEFQVAEFRICEKNSLAQLSFLKEDNPEIVVGGCKVGIDFDGAPQSDSWQGRYWFIGSCFVTRLPHLAHSYNPFCNS
jgi:hypothetical protein